MLKYWNRHAYITFEHAVSVSYLLPINYISIANWLYLYRRFQMQYVKLLFSETNLIATRNVRTSKLLLLAETERKETSYEQIRLVNSRTTLNVGDLIGTRQIGSSMNCNSTAAKRIASLTTTSSTDYCCALLRVAVCVRQCMDGPPSTLPYIHLHPN